MKAANLWIIALLSITSGGTVAFAQEMMVTSISGPAVPSPFEETIAQLSDRSKHFEAVAKYVGSGETNLQDKLAAARSAWALGLVQRARDLWDEALANPSFQDGERPRATLARAILEFQEGNYDQARAFAEAAANTLPPSDLRAQFWLVIAESLKEQKALSLAEAYYKKAVKDGNGAVKEEAKFLLGECQYRLALFNDSRYSYASVEAGSNYTARALRRLVEIDLQQKNYEGVLTWIEEGRESYPGDFGDGWMSYAMITALIELHRLPEAVKELSNVKTRLSDQNPWFLVAEAAVEGKRVAEDIVNKQVEKQ